MQVKVKILNPDGLLRPDMNASVASHSEEAAGSALRPSKPLVAVPAPAVHEGAVFLVRNGRAVRRRVKTGPASSGGVRIEEGGLYTGALAAALWPAAVPVRLMVAPGALNAIDCALALAGNGPRFLPSILFCWPAVAGLIQLASRERAAGN